MFSNQHRKAKLLFGASDVVLLALAFQAAYWTRLSLHLPNKFLFSTRATGLVLGLCIFVWLLFGYWLDVYGKLGIRETRVVVLDSVRQCGYGALGLIFSEYVLHLD